MIRLLWLHMVTKLQELKRVESNKRSFKSDRFIRLNPKNDDKYVELGYVYRDLGELSKAEVFLKKAIELNPKNNAIYAVLGGVYRDQTKFAEAEAILKKAIEFNPRNEEAYVELGYTYQDQAKLVEAEALFRKAIELNPKNEEAYGELGSIYRDQAKFAEADVFLRKAIELNPKNDDVYVELGYNYQDQGKLFEAETLFKKAVRFNSMLVRGYGNDAEELGLDRYPSITTDNYKKLKAILDKRGIVYVCVQYPMRNLKPLKKIFQDNGDGIIFVDNERIFKEALKQGSYWDYFRDMFGGDFGHCNSKGNRLLAENIANVILKRVFSN